VNTISRRFGILTLTSSRLFSRAPCTRIRSWLSAMCSAGDYVSVLVAMLIAPSAEALAIQTKRPRVGTPRTPADPHPPQWPCPRAPLSTRPSVASVRKGVTAARLSFPFRVGSGRETESSRSDLRLIPSYC
jgi:hypothetical protein